MISINPVSGSATGSSSSVESKSNKSSATGSSSQETTTAKKQESATVSISGRAIMLSRLFNSDGSVEPKVETTTTTSNTSGSVYSFLTKNDRDMLSTLYEYADANGIDPLKVDALAFDLGIYRRAGSGGPLDNAGKAYDLQGNPVIAEFNAEDEAVAQRVLTSKAMNDTLLDQGFLQAIFSPTRMSVHASDFAFLESITYAFSASGSDGATNPDAKPVVRYKAEDFPPLKLDDQALESGSKTMLSRLLEKELTGREGIIKLLDLLSNNDKNMLGRLYAIAQSRNEDLSKLDNIALMLGSYRMIGRRT